MKTLVLQSVAANPPAWIRLCMGTVRDFAQSRGADYRLLGDELFDEVPLRYEGYSKVTQSDLGRLRWIARLLRKGYDSVYWVDSDVLIWNADGLQFPRPKSGSVVCCREAWLMQRPRYHTLSFRVNNAILGFSEPNDVEILIERCEDELDRFLGEPGVPIAVVGTNLFGHSTFPLRRILISSVGCFSPDVIEELAGGSRRHLRSLTMAHGQTMCAANLCSSKGTPEEVMAEACLILLRDKSPDVGWRSAFSFLYRLASRVLRLADYLRYSLTNQPVNTLDGNRGRSGATVATPRI